MKTIEAVLKTKGNSRCFVTPDSSVESALNLMAKEQVGALPVFESGKLVGIIYDKDCITSALLDGKSIEEYRVKEIMTRKIINASTGQTIEECLALMNENHIQYLPVLADISFEGLVSMSDLFKSIVDDQKEYIYRLENYIFGFEYGR